jgi:hypothetical protein
MGGFDSMTFMAGASTSKDVVIIVCVSGLSPIAIDDFSG